MNSLVVSRPKRTRVTSIAAPSSVPALAFGEVDAITRTGKIAPGLFVAGRLIRVIALQNVEYRIPFSAAKATRVLPLP